MVTSCSAFGCTYRHKKGDNVGLFRFPTREPKLCQRWVMAVRRVNWTPSPTSRICGKHFLTGRPSKDENHPDYVPSLFVFNQNENRKEHWQKLAEEKASRRVAEILHSAPKVDVTGYRQLKPKIEGYGVPFVIKAIKADKEQSVNPAAQPCQFSTMIKENNAGNRKAVELSNSSGMSLSQEEITPSAPQRVWVLNLNSGKNSNASVEKPKEVRSDTASVFDSSITIYDDDDPLYVESMAVSDDSTLTAESSVLAVEDNESSMAGSENAELVNFGAIENVPSNVLDLMPSSVLNSVSDDTADSDYSDFKSSPFDAKEILAIKLETMLAINISLKQKVKFYQNKCKQHETEISNLRETVKRLKLKHSISYNN